MTRSRNTPASRTDSSLLAIDRLADDHLDETSRRAWTEAMTVRPFGDAYLVDCADRTHYVTLDPSKCSCDDARDERGGGDSADGDDSNENDSEGDDGDGDDNSDASEIDDASDGSDGDGSDDDGHNDGDDLTDGGDSDDGDRCVHVRRVAIEINLGRVPPPSEHTVECGGCDRAVAVSAADAPPYLCPECRLEPGDVVVDTDGDAETPLLVVSEPGRPADLVTVPDEERTVAEYPGNDRHATDAPVVEAVYAHAVSTDRQPRRYLFPLTRLGKPGASERRPPELGRHPQTTLEP